MFDNSANEEWKTLQYKVGLCVLWMFTVAGMVILVRTDVTGKQPKCSCIVKIVFVAKDKVRIS